MLRFECEVTIIKVYCLLQEWWYHRGCGGPSTENFIITIIMYQQSQTVEDNSDMKSDVALQEVAR